MAQNIAIENVNNEVANANEVQQLNNKKMEKVNETTVMKMQAVEEARQNLMRAKSVLEANKDAEANIKKSAQVNVGKAETAYLEALKKVKLPTTKIEVWNEVTNTAEQVTFTKEQKEIIIATSVYSMAVSKVNIECGKDLITNEHFDKVPLYITEAALFYNADIELKDLNGNTVPKGTPNVYVPVDKANGYWQWASYHEYNLNAIVKDDAELTIENVRIKKFESLQEFGKYRGVNNVLSRGFNGLEKAGNAALATQQEFFNKVFQKALELKANISVITKYYNFGKTLSLKVWNSAMQGVCETKLAEYDLTVGDTIIKTLSDMKISKDTIRHRYMIDAITQLANLAPNGGEKKIGLDETLNTIKTLNENSIKIINEVKSDHVNIIHYEILTQYLKNHRVIKEEQAA